MVGFKAWMQQSTIHTNIGKHGKLNAGAKEVTL